ncbi:MAG TPA: DKNYY domain-containing protein [Oligoflexus sp.]|uniref:DKNYY domain-containing protein n=1 Tax=Oligoflexus sp. TaxID=1971216 RepID=UPI002D313889|nr:DKNYY domain-containing protein [Oligoflexus sp.]HYX39345.1 DKNYY domain-containing protein [Oligoflexus sp.]
MNFLNKFILLALLWLGAVGCSKSDAELRILISYEGFYQFSGPTRLNLELVEHTDDGPSYSIGNLPFTITKLPQTLDVTRVSIAMDRSVSLRPTLDGLKAPDLTFAVFEEDSQNRGKVIHLRAREDLGHGYHRDASGIYSLGQKLPDCDPKTFSFVEGSGLYVRDAVHVYRGARLVAEDQGFQVIDGAYQKDATRIFHDGYVLNEADYASFEVYPVEGFARDKASVFSWGKIIAGADRSTFKPLDRSFAKDATSGYFGHEKIPGSLGATFRLVQNSAYSTDSSSVFFTIKKLQGADPTRFRTFAFDMENRPIAGYFATDESLVYFQGEPIAGADASSFHDILWGMGWPSIPRQGQKSAL